MFCSKCGNKIEDDSIFCTKCGNNTGNIDSNKVTIDITKNDVVKDNAQKVETLELEPNPKQNTEQQNGNLKSRKNPSKTNKNSIVNKILSLCMIITFIVVVLLIIDPNINKDTSKQTKHEEVKLSKTFTDSESGISFNYPEEWEISENLKPGEVVYLAAPKELGYTVAMNISKDDMIIEMYRSYNSNSSISKSLELSGFDVQDVVDTTIDGISGRKIIYTLTNEHDEYKEYSALQYIYSIDDVVYLISFTAPIDNLDEYEPIFNSIMESYAINSSTEITHQDQQSENDGLSKQQALAVAQEFIDTHPLYDRIITGDIEYEPEGYPYSTEGLYGIQLIADDGSYRTMWVQKSNGDIFISSDSVTLLTGEEFYDDLSVSFQYSDEILFDGTTIISDYLGTRPKYLYDDFGPPEYGTDVDGSLYEGGSYMGYDGIEFVYDEDTSSIEYIFVDPTMCTFNGVTLDKNHDELVNLLGIPSSEGIINDDMNETYYYLMTYYMGSYTIQFELENEYSNAYLIGFYYNE